MATKPIFASAKTGILQRACACGQQTSSADHCEACQKKHPDRLHRAVVNNTLNPNVPPIVHDVLRSPGQPLDANTRANMEPRFGHDFSNVRLHTDQKAGESARAVNALAYTVGRDVVFAEGQYLPGTTAGQKLVAHELTHVVQQNSVINGSPLRDNLTINQHDDVFEQEANSMAERVIAGTSTGEESLTRSHPVIQRETPGDASEKKPHKEPADVIVEGLKIVGDQAKNNPKVKRVIIAPIEEKLKPVKNTLKGKWDQLSRFQKATAISAGVGALAGTLADPEGRKLLEGINLAAPLNLIPGMPDIGFKYTLPSGDSPEKRQLKVDIDVAFNAGDLFNQVIKAHGLPHMPLRVNMRWGYDPSDGQLSIKSGNASLGIMRGLSLSGGVYRDVLRLPQATIGAGGQMTQIKKRIPDFDKPQPIPDARIMINVDILEILR